MRPDSLPVTFTFTFTINLPPLPDEAVIKIQDFLFEILEQFENYYGHQIQRFINNHSRDNIVQHNPNLPIDDPPV